MPDMSLETYPKLHVEERKRKGWVVFKQNGTQNARAQVPDACPIQRNFTAYCGTIMAATCPKAIARKEAVEKTARPKDILAE